MKMTKIESARIVHKQKGSCLRLRCFGCFNEKWCDSKGCYSSDKFCPDKLRLAEAYIKRHDGKSKKRIIPKYTADVQPDTTGSELKKIVMKPANTDPTPLEIAKMIRDNNYLCHGFKCLQCPLKDSDGGCGNGVTNGSPRLLRKQLIDSYIKANEPACEHLVGDLCGNAFETCDKECLANSEILKPEPKKVVCVDGIGGVLTVGKEYTAEPAAKYDDMYLIKIDSGEKHEYYKTRFVSIEEYANRTTQNEKPEPIKFDDPVPEYVYKVSDSSIKIRKVLRFRRIDEKEADGTRKTLEYIQTNNGDYDFKNCYKTLDEAVDVAKKNWGLE